MSGVMDNDIERVLYTQECIAQKVAELGKQITADYQGRKPLLVAVLRGAFVFMADIARAIEIPCDIDFMAVSSYGASVHSSGTVRIIKDLEGPLDGRDVLIIEDVLDSGLTLEYLSRNLRARGCASLEIATLLLKNEHPAVTPRYVGFHCPSEFVVGYGLDYAEAYRNLPYIGVLKPSVYEGAE